MFRPFFYDDWGPTQNGIRDTPFLTLATSRRSTSFDFFSIVRSISNKFLSAVSETKTFPRLVNRIVVTGMAGAGKSTLSRVLATKTGLPVIHLDLHSWHPGWVRVAAEEFLDRQRILLAGEKWIVDSNDVDNDLLVARADTLVILSTPWWICSWRAFKRGLRRPPGIQLPDGCDDSFSQRLGDEWGIVWRNWRKRKSVRAEELSLEAQCRERLAVFVLGSKQDVADFMASL